MPLRWFLVLVGVVAIIGALVALATPITLSGMHKGASIQCGSVLSPDQTTAHQADLASAIVDPLGAGSDYRGECNAAAGQRKAWAIPTMVLAGVVILGALVVRRPTTAT